ncbi:hypothetical protein Sgly_1362 [Syntrophobotulus glycolicus DSM 8271]|uniref:Uncharacterized protein n=1 Tax=Syntrophobotulus glycolicus (strain DSM 8271 / FlGlyR) TaxID=645991 RepID=F0SVW1_SYNGF|nr:hypothetical protein [Syntrophobotulus glycolicus]ADY55667.1 hypothetical protein Sgly_1362 [Syntrophobotulus glycolicus DSM 8271]
MIKEELKKIWSPGILIILLFLGFVFNYMFMDFYITYFPNGSYAEGAFQTAKEWIRDYGTSLEPEEEAEIVKVRLPELKAEADRFVAQNELCRRYGLTAYADFEAFYQENVLEVQGNLTKEQQTRYADAHIILNYLQGEEANNIEGRLRAVQDQTERYEQWQSNGFASFSRAYDATTEREYSYAQTAFFDADAAWRNILPREVPIATSTYLALLLVWMVLSDCLLLSPLLVRDRMRGMRALQWSSRRGRGILKTQFAAVMLSAFLLTTLNFLIFGGLFARNGTSVFAACRMFSFMDTMLPWVNWTYGTWCMVLVILCYLASLGIAALAFFFSRYSANYVAMLLKIIPLFVAAAILCYHLVLYAFHAGNPIFGITEITGTEALLTGLIFLLGLVLCLAACARQKRQDLLTE